MIQDAFPGVFFFIIREHENFNFTAGGHPVIETFSQ
jgi:hypothetical protein